MFKQFLQASALQFVQIDSCRLGSVNENLAVLLMAHKFQGKTPDTESHKSNIAHPTWEKGVKRLSSKSKLQLNI